MLKAYSRLLEQLMLSLDLCLVALCRLAAFFFKRVEYSRVVSVYFWVLDRGGARVPAGEYNSQ